jgi:pimeloyl-ACP methyl ester carboxylesterase
MKLNLNLYQLSCFGIILSCLASSYTRAADVPSLDPAYNSYVKPQQLVGLPNGRKIHLFCEGVGSPTVIFTAGLGDWSAVWNKVQGPIALKTRTCSWDRAGYGFSSPSPFPQDVRHTTDDLEAALKAAGIAGPYLFVGHSLGGYESLRFADRHPDEVAGMVLVDPAIPDMGRRNKIVAPDSFAAIEIMYGKAVKDMKTCAKDLKSRVLTLASPDPNACFNDNPEYPLELNNAMRQLDSDPTRWLTAASLMSLFDKSSRDIINTHRNYGDMPLRILTAGNPLETPPSFSATAIAQAPAFKAELVRGHDAMAALSTNGANIVVPGTTHYIQLIKPEIVISTISQVVDEIQLSGNIARKQRVRRTE